MSLKFNLQVSKDSVEEARSLSGQRYNGPTPPPDIYVVQLKRLISQEDKNGNPVFVAVLEINETGEKEIYNGAGVFYRLALPVDNTLEYFKYQVKALDDFLRAISGDTMDVESFGNLASAGKIIEDSDNKDAKGNPMIKSIGKLKLDKTEDLTIKLRHREYNGKTYTDVHYIDLDASLGQKASAEEPEEDIDDFDDLDDLDDLDDILDGDE